MLNGRRPATLEDVVAAQLCCGCGACAAFCDRGVVSLLNDEALGIRPVFAEGGCGECRDCLALCPGAVLDYDRLREQHTGPWHPLLGPYLEVFEGYATDPEMRFRASSGGVLSAIALYCLEQEGMEAVFHTAMDEKKPWLNRTARSTTREAILRSAGSRYAPSSPCEALREIETAKNSCVFIGKPCDAAAVYHARHIRPKLDRTLGLVLSFFCAGTPVTKATLDYLALASVSQETVNSIRYRGNGWPGNFEVLYEGGQSKREYSYKESWGWLARQRRPFRCSLCPDGMGEFADISCGDAWHLHRGEDNPGVSSIVVRTPRGREILNRAINAGYVCLQPSDPERILSGQGLQKRRKELHGRLLALRLTGWPRPFYRGLDAAALWRDLPLWEKIRVTAGTARRVIIRFYLNG